QIAAALFNEMADRFRARALSAGTKPAASVHPIVIEAMKEVGIDLSNEKPQLLTEDLAREAILLVTMGCGEECPVVPGLPREDWSLPDPKDKPIEEVRVIRDNLRARVEMLIDREGWRPKA